MIANMPCTNSVPLLDRLDDFFSGSCNTETIRCFIENDKFITDDTELYYCSKTADRDHKSGNEGAPCENGTPTTELCLDTTTDSEQSLRLYAAFREYSVILEGLLSVFFEREAAAGINTQQNEVAESVMKEWVKPEGSFRYMCIVYIAAALDFDAFRQLLADFRSIRYYQMSDSEDNYEE